MPKPFLEPKLAALENDIIATMRAGLKEWRPDLSWPESHSDMQGCVRAVLRMFEVRRRPLPKYGKGIFDDKDGPFIARARTLLPELSAENKLLRDVARAGEDCRSVKTALEIAEVKGDKWTQCIATLERLCKALDALPGEG